MTNAHESPPAIAQLLWATYVASASLLHESQAVSLSLRSKSGSRAQSVSAIYLYERPPLPEKELSGLPARLSSVDGVASVHYRD